MPDELSVIQNDVLTQEERTELDKNLDLIILQHKDNRQEINRLVFESVAAMTEADTAQSELSNKGFFKRFIGGITGSNQKLQNEINTNRAVAQYVSQQTLQKLAEQNLMTFDLITAVNNKLNASINAVDEEFKNIYDGLNKFLKYNRNELARVEARLAKVEQNVNLLTWQNTIEYQEYDGEEYINMDVTKKIVCLTRDFYDITKGNWSTSDLLLLKTALSTINIQPKDKVNYYDALREISRTPQLKNKLLGNAEIKPIVDPSFLISLGTLEKLDALEQREAYLVDTIMDYVNVQEGQIDRKDVCDRLTYNYLWQHANVNLNIEVECYDLILDLLYNLKQANEEGILVIPTDEIGEFENVKEDSEVKKMFIKCNIDEALPLLKDLSTDGDKEARFILSLIYYLGIGVEHDNDYANQMTRLNLDDGYCMPAIRGAVNGVIEWDNASDYISEIKDLAERGDAFAQQEMGIYYLNLDSATLGKESNDYETAMKYFEMCAKQGFFLGYHSMGLRYYNGDIDGNKDYTNAMKYFFISADMGYGWSMKYIGDMYWNGNGVEKDIDKAIEWYKKAYEHSASNDFSINQIARYYSKEGSGDNLEALKWWEIGEKHHYAYCTSNLGWAYRWGKGVNIDYDKAAYYFEEAIKIQLSNGDSGNGYERRNLAEMYLNGDIKRNLDYSTRKQLAINEYRGAANEGDLTAKQWLEDNGIDLVMRL